MSAGQRQSASFLCLPATCQGIRERGPPILHSLIARGVLYRSEVVLAFLFVGGAVLCAATIRQSTDRAPGDLAPAMLDGDPGLGKSLLALDLCTRRNTGWPCADEQAGASAGNPIVLNAEDAPRTQPVRACKPGRRPGAGPFGIGVGGARAV
jgi:hypothetical protein